MACLEDPTVDGNNTSNNDNNNASSTMNGKNNSLPNAAAAKDITSNTTNTNANRSSTTTPEQPKVQHASPDGGKLKPIPRRNLSQAFEALCDLDDTQVTLEEEDTDSSEEQKVVDSSIAPTVDTSAPAPVDLGKTTAVPAALISPTGVTDVMEVNASSAAGTTTTTMETPKPSSLVRSDTPPTSAVPASAATATMKTATTTTTKPPLRSYEFDLHPELRRELSQALVNRVSFYGIIHDINKEAACMAANDPKQQEQYTPTTLLDTTTTTTGGSVVGIVKEEDSPLVQAVTGETTIRSESVVTSAMIDEEQWLLDAISSRRPEERSTTTGPTGTTANTATSTTMEQATTAAPVAPPVCPPTFSQAMGEKEYENPVHALSGGNRTQLWKPSRSWWEAKSGKNPWIEPSSHNKRWRYLWPLIHYHKFLAKCIKKLKRNGVDVKQSVSPVAVFLREEVCAVSDHLKDVSLFGSDEWIACLQHFNGWTDTASEDDLRKLVGTLKLRPLLEPGDVDSPLLRSQIDEHFLRAMEAARTQLRDGPTGTASSGGSNVPDTVTKSKHKGQPPMYPRQPGAQQHASAAASTNSNSTPSALTQQSGVRRPRFVPTPHGGGVANHHPHHYQQQYWGWDQHSQHHHYHHAQQHHSAHHAQQHSQQSQQQPPPVAYGDNMSVQSGLSADSCYGGGYSEYPPSHGPPPPMHYPYYSPAGYASDGSQYSYEQHHAAYHQQHHQQHVGWVDPSMHYAMQANHAYYGGTPMAPQPTSSATEDIQQPSSELEGKEAISPVKYSQPQAQQSPFWSHLDRCVAMGLATPAKASPSTPRRTEDENASDDVKEEEVDVVHDCHHYEIDSTADLTCTGLPHEEKSAEFASNAQPLLLRQYYGYSHYGAQDGYAPPSPATQFMMSPQANFAYNIGYGSSPGRQGRTPRKPRAVAANAASAPPLPVAKTTTTLSPTASASAAPLMPPPSVHKVMERESPSTVETTTESTDMEDHAAATN